MSFFDYFQVAGVICFLLIVVTRIIYLRLNRHINAVAIGGGKTGWPLFFELLSFVGLITWIIELLTYALHTNFHLFPSPLDTLLINSSLARIVGVISISAGTIIFILAFVSFGDSWRIGFDVKTPGALVTTGVFSLSRNPIYVFIDLWFLGTFLINGRLIFLIFTLLAMGAVHWQILQEENFLLKLYGQPYRDYCARTGRYIW